MAINIPNSVFTKYHEGVDAMFDAFGVSGILLSTDKVVQASGSHDTVPHMKSVNSFRRHHEDYTRENTVYQDVENRKLVLMRVYWDKKDWVKAGGNIVVPNNGIQTIFYADNLKDVSKAIKLIVHDGIDDVKELTFKRFSEPFPFGFGHDKYYACFWERAT